MFADIQIPCFLSCRGAAVKYLTGSFPHATLQAGPTCHSDVGHWRTAVVRLGVALVTGWLVGCGAGGGGGYSGPASGTQPLPPPVVAVVPAQVTVTKGRTVTLSAVVVGAGPGDERGGCAGDGDGGGAGDRGGRVEGRFESIPSRGRCHRGHREHVFRRS